jgi:molybdate transport system permease protein
MSQFLSPEEWSALRLSLSAAATAATAALPLAVAVGYLLARGRFPGKWLVESAVMLPLVLPPVVTGYLLLVLVSPRGPVGAWLADWFDVRLVFTWWAVVLAAMVVSFPLMVRAARLAFHAVDPRLDLAARSLGAGRLTTFFAVTLPLARRGVLAGWTLGFARSLGEFGATVMVAGNIAGRTRTIPLLIYTQANRPDGIDRAWRLVIFSIVLACVALVASELLERRHERHESA